MKVTRNRHVAKFLCTFQLIHYKSMLQKVQLNILEKKPPKKGAVKTGKYADELHDVDKDLK